MPDRWRITHQDDVARIAPARGPARMDVVVHAAWDAPAADALPKDALSHRRYRVETARQIRQDLWRALQRVRGFAPVVEVASDHSGQGGEAEGAVRVMVSAGGRLDVAQAPREVMEEKLRALLSSRSNRARWRAHARRRARPRPEDVA